MTLLILLIAGQALGFPSRVERASEDLYGSWDWFLDQIKLNNNEAKPTESPKPTTSYRFGQRVSGELANSDDKFGWFKPLEQRSGGITTPSTNIQDPVPLQSRGSDRNSIFSNENFFNPLSGSKVKSPELSSRLNTNFQYQFMNKADNQALMWDAFYDDKGGSGDDYDSDRTASFTAFGHQSTQHFKPDVKDTIFTFNTNNPSSNTEIGEMGWGARNVADNTLLPVSLINDWPSNEQALGGAIFEVINFIFGQTGTCYLRLPQAVYWFHVFNAHIDPIESEPSSGLYALIAANQAFEGVATLDFIVNFQNDDLRFDQTNIELSCDSANTWTTSILSFPGNTVGDVGRTNVRANDGFEGKKIVIEFIYDVDGFYVDDHRLTVNPSTGSGNTFEITSLSGTLLEEVWFGWSYRIGGWFTAADVLIGYFDEV